MQHGESCSGAALRCSIVENSDARSECCECGGVCDIGAPVMSDEVDIDRTNETGWADKVEQRRSAQVTHVEKTEFSESKDKPGRPRILMNILCRNR